MIKIAPKNKPSEQIHIPECDFHIALKRVADKVFSGQEMVIHFDNHIPSPQCCYTFSKQCIDTLPFCMFD